MLQILRLSEKHIIRLRDLLNSEDLDKFHPHPFTHSHLLKLCNIQSKDLYYILYNDGICGYGMLRGWEEGYDVPSLGIVIFSKYRGTGLAKMFMNFLHTAAKVNGSNKVRLKVYKDNHVAHKLYGSMGYCFEDFNDEELIGHINL